MIDFRSIHKTALAVVTFIALFSAHPAQAYEALVVCGGEPAYSSIEIDFITVARGQHIYAQLVLRNSEIISDFISKQAIYGDEVNSKGEFILEGYYSDRSFPIKFSGSIDNRHFSFSQMEDHTYKLAVSYTDESFKDYRLADFIFKNCYSF